jgi:hypothetical protein
MSQSKDLRTNAEERYYRTPAGAAVRCTIRYASEYDPSDGEQPGYYGWCGAAHDQSDYVIGPYESVAEVFSVYERRNPTHMLCKKVTLYRDRPPEFVREKSLH